MIGLEFPNSVQTFLWKPTEVWLVAASVSLSPFFTQWVITPFSQPCYFLLPMKRLAGEASTSIDLTIHRGKLTWNSNIIDITVLSHSAHELRMDLLLMADPASWIAAKDSHWLISDWTQNESNDRNTIQELLKNTITHKKDLIETFGMVRPNGEIRHPACRGRVILNQNPLGIINSLVSNIRDLFEFDQFKELQKSS